nr:MAG TPA: hypothetical protein [Caudoviricetes sp.]
MVIYIENISESLSEKQHIILEAIRRRILRHSHYHPVELELNRSQTIDERTSIVEHAINLSSKGFDVLIKGIGYIPSSWIRGRVEQIECVGTFEMSDPTRLVWVQCRSNILNGIGES